MRKLLSLIALFSLIVVGACTNRGMGDAATVYNNVDNMPKALMKTVIYDGSGAVKGGIKYTYSATDGTLSSKMGYIDNVFATPGNLSKGYPDNIYFLAFQPATKVTYTVLNDTQIQEDYFGAVSGPAATYTGDFTTSDSTTSLASAVMTYNAQGQLQNEAWTINAGSTNALLYYGAAPTVAYEYDSVTGNLTKRTRTFAGIAASDITVYLYNEKGQRYKVVRTNKNTGAAIDHGDLTYYENGKLKELSWWNDTTGNPKNLYGAFNYYRAYYEYDGYLRVWKTTFFKADADKITSNDVALRVEENSYDAKGYLAQKKIRIGDTSAGAGAFGDALFALYGEASALTLVNLDNWTVSYIYTH